MDAGIPRLCVIIGVSVTAVVVFTYLFGFNRSDRQALKNMFLNKSKTGSDKNESA
jgi:hypothetical protein